MQKYSSFSIYLPPPQFFRSKKLIFKSNLLNNLIMFKVENSLFKAVTPTSLVTTFYLIKSRLKSESNISGSPRLWYFSFFLDDFWKTLKGKIVCKWAELGKFYANYSYYSLTLWIEKFIKPVRLPSLFKMLVSRNVFL